MKYGSAGLLPRKLNVDLNVERNFKWTDKKLFVDYMKVSETVLHAYRCTKSGQSTKWNNNLRSPDVNWKEATVGFFIFSLLVIIYISSFESEYTHSKSNHEQLGEQTTTN